MGWEELANPLNVGMAMLMAMATLATDTGIAASVSAELSMFFLSSSVLLFASAVTRPKQGVKPVLMFVLCFSLSVLFGVFAFPLAALMLFPFSVFLYAFMRSRDDWLFPFSISLIMSVPALYVFTFHLSVKWLSYVLAFISISFSLLARFQIKQSFKPGEVHNMATKYGIVRAKSAALWSSAAFSMLSLISAALSPIITSVLIGLAIALALLSHKLTASAAFYITAVSLLLFSGAMVVI